MIKKISLIGFIATVFINFAVAGTEDWTGEFKVKMSKNSTETVIHTPSQVKFLFFSAGKCLMLSKGSQINDFIAKDDITLCTSEDVESFTREIQKIGSIVSQTIHLGATYPEGSKNDIQS